MKAFKIIASKAGRIVYDDRLDAECPREAREKMKTALGLESLTGIVYAITEIPVDVIREIVTAHLAGIVAPTGRRVVDIPLLIAAAVDQAVNARLTAMETKLASIETGSATGARRLDVLATGNTATPEPPANGPTRAIPEPLRAAIEGPNWKAIKRQYLRTRSVKQTAAQFDISPNTLKARIRREAW